MLSIQPQSCLQDEDVCIRATGLSPNQSVTFSSHIRDSRNKDYFAYAHYRADESGNIDNYKQEAIGGHFTGLFPMGLIAALRPAPHEYEFLRLFKKDVENPNKIEIWLHDGLLEPKEIFEIGRTPLSIAINYRHFMGPGVKKIIIKEGRVRGSLFLPPGKGPFPGVIDLFGTAGGLLEFRAAQFASRGIASLAVAYFGYDDLPESPVEYDLDYFKEAAQILLSYEPICKPCVGVVGVSKGGDLALSMAAFLDEVSLAISINGCNANTNTPIIIHGNKTLPGINYDLSKIKILSNGVLLCDDIWESPVKFSEAIIPLHETNAFIMFIVGEDDCNFRSSIYAEDATNRMKKFGKTNYKVCSYENAGHLIEPPYSAFCHDSYHKVVGYPVCWGGELIAHTAAQIDSWKQMLSCIKENLSNQTKSKL